MTKHYIKAYYKIISIDCILFQREDDRFVLIPSTLRSRDKNWFLECFVESNTKWDKQTVNYSGWTSDTRDFIQLALSGNLKPFWTCEDKVENKVVEENKCTCPYENFTWTGVGCQCKGV